MRLSIFSLFRCSRRVPPPRYYLLPWLQGSPGFCTPGPTPPPDPQRSGEHTSSQGHAHHHQVKAKKAHCCSVNNCICFHGNLDGGKLPNKPSILLFSTITSRNKETSRDEFIFYSKRLMRLLIERALSFLPSQVPNTNTNTKRFNSSIVLHSFLIKLRSLYQGGHLNNWKTTTDRERCRRKKA